MLQRLGHRAKFLFITLAVLALTTSLLHLLWNRPALFVLQLLFLLLTVGVLALGVRHDRGICTDCVRDAPVNGQEEAARHDRTLRFLHWCRQPLPLTLTGLLLLSCFVVPFVVPGIDRVQKVTLAQLWLIPCGVVTHAETVHRRLQPWCPRCAWGTLRDRAAHGGDNIAGKLDKPAPEQRETDRVGRELWNVAQDIPRHTARFYVRSPPPACVVVRRDTRKMATFIQLDGEQTVELDTLEPDTLLRLELPFFTIVKGSRLVVHGIAEERFGRSEEGQYEYCTFSHTRNTPLQPTEHSPDDASLGELRELLEIIHTGGS